MTKNLIVKSSFSMLTDRSGTDGGDVKSNWGDLIRTAIIAECLKGDYLWLTEARSVPLLKWIINEKNIITYEDFDFSKLQSGLEIYNADNYVPNEAVFNQLEGNWHGYVWDGNKLFPENDIILETESYAEAVLDQTWQQSLVEGLGFKWTEQDYPTPAIKTSETFDVGLNWNVHLDWTAKWWAKDRWKGTDEALTKAGYTVSWQQGLNDFDEYMKWMNSCRLVISVETLGLHLASALKKKVIALIGPASNSEFSYGRVHDIKPNPRACMPCNMPKCDKDVHCMDDITVQQVTNLVQKLL